MTTNSQRTAAVQPVGPSRFVRIVMGPMTKVLNPMIRRLAGRRHFWMAGKLRHVGRRSGRPYVTPVGARVSGDMIVIPLTFGNQSDWSKNVRAAGSCAIRVNGREYTATQPQLLGIQEARQVVRAAFSPMERASFRMLGIRQVMTLHAAEQ
jgi:deazaflavin-dependent oxidoreductase (nitroreductase family)